MFKCMCCQYPLLLKVVEWIYRVSEHKALLSAHLTGYGYTRLGGKRLVVWFHLADRVWLAQAVEYLAMRYWVTVFNVTGPNEWLCAMETAREGGGQGSEDDASQDDTTSVSESPCKNYHGNNSFYQKELLYNEQIIMGNPWNNVRFFV